VTNACIFQYDFDYAEKSLYHEVRTDQYGRATIVESRFIRGSIDNSGHEWSEVRYPTWGFRVGSEGYKTTEYISLQDRIGLVGDPKNGGLKPPEIVVELKKNVQAREGDSVFVEQW